MPDPEKHAALEAAGFSIAKVCASCVHWTPSSVDPGHRWGYCSLVEYRHGKHSGIKLAGTPEMGTCPSHEADLRGIRFLGEDYLSRYAED